MKAPPGITHVYTLSGRQVLVQDGYVLVPDDDAPPLIRAGFARTRLALRLAVLTFVRTTELRGARWEEIDLEAAEWRIPAERMKMGKPHIVPLSRQAVEAFTELHPLAGESG